MKKLKEMFILKEDRALGSSQLSTQLGPDTDIGSRSQGYSSKPIPSTAKLPTEPDHYGPVQPGTINLSLEDWNYLEDIVGSAIQTFGDDPDRVINILNAVREGMKSLKVK